DPAGEAGVARERSAAEQGHPLLLPAELRESRFGGQGESRISRHDQALPASEPGLDGASARARRQRAHQRIPLTRGRGAGAYDGAASHGAVEAACRRRARRAARSSQGHRYRAYRDRRTRLGGAHEPREREESQSRSAVVHDRVAALDSVRDGIRTSELSRPLAGRIAVSDAGADTNVIRHAGLADDIPRQTLNAVLLRL